MAKTDISENIYRAIDTIVDARLQNINFNSTILCTIIDDSKAASGVYTVDNAGVKFQATSLDKSLRNNDQVYITVPNNDFSAQKIILCKKDDLKDEVEGWRNPLEYLDIKYKFDDESDIINLSPTQGEAPSEAILIKQIILNDDIKFTIFTDNIPGNSNCTSEGINELNEEDQNHIKDILWIQTQDVGDLRGYKQNSASQYFQELKNAGWAELIPTIDDYNYTFSHGGHTSLRIKKNISPYRTLLFCHSGLSTRYIIHTYPFNQNGITSEILTQGPSANKYTDASSLKYYIWANSYGNNDTISFNGWDIYNKYYPTNPLQAMYLGYCVFYNKKHYQPIYLAGLKNIIFSIDCKSNLLNYGIQFGTYGAYCKLYLANRYDLNNTFEIQLNMSSNQDFLGDPYNFFDFYTQTAIFNVENYQDYILNKIEFYCYQNGDFDLSDAPQGGDYKIQFCHPKIYLGIPKKETITGYKNYESYFATSGKYYQKLDLVGVINIYENLRQIPPIDTELDSDGPLRYTIGDYYQLTNDITNDPNKTYFYNINGSQSYAQGQPTNPKEKKCYEYINMDENGKRYVPKLYFKNSNGNFYSSSYDEIKYYDDLFYQPGWITTHDWVNNKYFWNSTEKVWKLRQGQTASDDYPAILEPYICYLPGRIINGTVGIISSSSEANRPQLGITTNNKEVDLVLSTENNDSSIIINNSKSHIQITNNSLDLNFKDKSTIELNNDTLELNYNDKSILELNDNNGIKLHYGTTEAGNQMVLRLGYYNNAPAINITIKEGETQYELHLAGADLTKLRTIIDNN